eukprot:1069351-Pyramimonas_sp.AAC.1
MAKTFWTVGPNTPRPQERAIKGEASLLQVPANGVWGAARIKGAKEDAMKGAKEMLGASKAMLEGKFASTFSLDDVRNILDMTLEAVETNVMAFEPDSAGKEQILVHTRIGLYMTGVMCSALIFESLPVRIAVDMHWCTSHTTGYSSAN